LRSENVCVLSLPLPSYPQTLTSTALPDVKTISKFAQLEFKLGDAERGRTIFEGIMDSYPKRLDLWFVYIDMEIKQRNIEGVRALFERVLASRLSSSKSPLFLVPPLVSHLTRFVSNREGQVSLQEVVDFRERVRRWRWCRDGQGASDGVRFKSTGRRRGWRIDYPLTVLCNIIVVSRTKLSSISRVIVRGYFWLRCE